MEANVKAAAAVLGCLVAVVLAAPPSQGSRPFFSPVRPFNISISREYGRITDSRTVRDSKDKPDFILIQSVESNPSIQQSISAILAELKAQNLVPDRIAIEGHLGKRDIQKMQLNQHRRVRQHAADYLASLGEINGATHFVVSEGAGDLVVAENPEVYDASEAMLRNSYTERARLAKNLAKLDAALTLLQDDPRSPAELSILAQDVRALNHLIDMKLRPEEVHRVMLQAIYAVDHLKDILSEQMNTQLLEPVSSAVNFYALALLRDEDLFSHSMQLRETDEQSTTILVAGGFHTAGLVRRLNEQGYSYVVITPEGDTHDEVGERLYAQRLLGYRLTPEQAAHLSEQIASQSIASRADMKSPETAALAELLLVRMHMTELMIPPVGDIFTAMDQPLQTSVQLALLRQRSRIIGNDAQAVLQVETSPLTR
jgi:hypothetical protein